MPSIYDRAVNTCQALAVILLAILVVGCAANKPQQQTDVGSNPLYEGRAPTAFSNLPVAKSIPEAVAWGTQAANAGEIDKALYLYIQALEMDAEQTDVLYKIGQLHLKRTNLTKARHAFRSVLDIDPEHIRAQEGMGGILLRQNKPKLAWVHFAAAVTLDQARFPMGEASKDGSKTPVLVAAFDTQSPAQAYNGLGIISDMRGLHRQAQGYFQAALEIAPGNLITLNNLGYSFYMDNRPQEAERLFKQVLRSNSKFHQAWRNLGLLYARQGDYVRALDALEQVMDSAHAHNDVGYVAMLAGDYSNAEYLFRQALTLSPRFYPRAQENLNQLRRLQVLTAPAG